MLPGHSANPGGRPRGSRNLITLFNKMRDEKVPVQVGAKTVQMTRMEAFVTNLWTQAIALEPKATVQLVGILRASGQLTPPAGDDASGDPASVEVLNGLLERLLRARGDDGPQ